MHFVLNYLYPLLYTVALLLYFPIFLVRLFRGEQSWRPIWRRAGRLPRSLRELPPKEAPRVWIHSVSVGEANSLRPLVEQLGLSRDRLFISTTTETGQAVARRLYSEEATVFFFPLDWKASCRRYLRAVAPDLVILTETELWPSFIHCVRTARIPLLLVNGRVSRRSLGYYDPAHDLIVISKLFDSAKVPRLLVEYILYHEMLHKKYPAEYRSVRRCVHTRQFKAEERKYPHYSEAVALLKSI